MACKICGQPTSTYGNAIVLNKYQACYLQCCSCGFVQVENPYWLTEAYADTITSGDLGLVARNLSNSKICRTLIPVFFEPNGRFLDYGGGYGLFVRMMRDTGFNFYLFDPLCQNLFAKRFVADPTSPQRYELLTAFEVFEHLVNPLQDIEQMLMFSSNILFSTWLLPPTHPRPSEWQYFGLDHGQHISFFTEKTLAVLAKKFNLHLHSCRRSLHLLSRKQLKHAWLFDGLADYRIASIISVLRKRPSLTPSDYFYVTGSHLQE